MFVIVRMKQFYVMLLLLLMMTTEMKLTPTKDSSSSTPITCFVCYDCFIYEGLQKRQCEDTEQFCLVYLLQKFEDINDDNGIVQREMLDTDEVNRNCATKEYCESVANNPKFSCCNTDNCNSGKVEILFQTMYRFSCFIF